MPSPSQSDQAFAALFDAHMEFVWRVLWRHGVPDAELPDACQEVFLVVHARLADFEGRSSIRTWIYGIAMRVALATRRKAHRRRELPSAEPPEQLAELDVQREGEQRQLISRLDAALASLPAEKREVFVLYELEGLTMAEVARALGVPENTALSRLYSARAAVRALIEPVAPQSTVRRLGGKR